MTQAELARHFRVDDAQITGAKHRGEIVPREDGRFDLEQAKETFGRRRAMRAAIRAASDPPQAARREAAKAKRTVAKMELMERQDDELTKGTLERDDAAERLNSSAISLRARSTFARNRKPIVLADLADARGALRGSRGSRDSLALVMPHNNRMTL